MKRLLYIAIILIFLLFVSTSMYSNVVEKEKKVLLDLYNSTQGDKWSTTWNLEAPVSQWYGIKVHEGHVVEIDLFENNLVGQLPENIGELQYLQSLNLAFNLLSGEIPKSIVKMHQLKVLKLEMNRIVGKLPENLGEMESLEELSLFNNFLSGGIPVSVGEL